MCTHLTQPISKKPGQNSKSLHNNTLHAVVIKPLLDLLCDAFWHKPKSSTQLEESVPVLFVSQSFLLDTPQQRGTRRGAADIITKWRNKTEWKRERVSYFGSYCNSGEWGESAKEELADEEKGYQRE